MIQQLVRKNIQNLVPYSSARDEFKGNDAIFLDANENPFGKLNRYPDPYQRELKFLLSEEKNIPQNNIFIGNGSDEVIDLTLRIFCEPQQDKILICPPTYGMYEVSADINNIETIKVPLTDDFQLDIPTVLDKIKTESVKIVFLCSPNNPTGNSLNDIDLLLEKFNGIVVVDEAYIDFSERQSYLQKIKDYPNLIVSQTFSKAWGLAGARVGLAYAAEEIIAFFNRVKPPYNISQLNQQAAIETLKNKPEFKQNLTTILTERERLTNELQQLNLIQKIYPTDANFILVKIPDATEVYQQLVRQRIITRNRSSVISDCIRITIGTPEENDLLINELKKRS